jgi:uncharacterized membrane protein HdeD (DUF308 family)
LIKQDAIQNRVNRMEEREMTKAQNWTVRFRQRRRDLLGAAAVGSVGLILIYIADNLFNPTVLSQALVAYVGVFAVAGGVLYGVSTLLNRE